MLPIPFLSPSPALPGAPGALPAAASVGLDFAALLPGALVPTLPRQRDGGDGNILPAASGKDEEGGDDAPAAIWIAPPAWVISCPPPASVGAREARFDLVAAEPLPSADLPRVPAQLTASPVHAPAGAQASADDTSASFGVAVITSPAEGVASLAPVPLATSPDAAMLAALPDAVAPPELLSTPPRRAAIDGTQDLVARSSMNAGAAAPAQQQTGEAIMPAPELGRSPTFDAEGVVVTPLSPGRSERAVQNAVQQASPAPLQNVAVEPVRPGQVPVASTTAPQDDAVARPARGEPQLPDDVSDDRSPLTARPRLPVGIAPHMLHPAQAGQVAPAAQIFAAAIHRATRDDRAAGPGEALITANPAAMTDLAPHPVAAIDGGRHAALDMFRETWPTKMIERIEMIRDAMDAVDTSIRLVPDKLGTIDVSLRRDGDAVAVQFNAQQAETRQLLADAQPKLAELAEARGLKLTAQAGHGDGQSQHSHQQQRAPSAAPLSPDRASRIASDDDAALADERIA